MSSGGSNDRDGEVRLTNARYAVRHMITDVIFVHFKQFVRSSDGNEDFGSKWQRAVCKDVKMTEEDLRRFWDVQKGRQIARRILNCRRNNAMNSMKAKFEGESKSLQMC